MESVKSVHVFEFGFVDDTFLMTAVDDQKREYDFGLRIPEEEDTNSFYTRFEKFFNAKINLSFELPIACQVKTVDGVITEILNIAGIAFETKPTNIASIF